jgi:hypothetical protein
MPRFFRGIGIGVLAALAALALFRRRDLVEQ